MWAMTEGAKMCCQDGIGLIKGLVYNKWDVCTKLTMLLKSLAVTRPGHKEIDHWSKYL